ncbi:carboxypeptidase S1 [Lactarius akahatsu]|uniref:Carboxypeptidase S1 n=1 Tax=Lactarius akahatsu TaxID=416441 RepID=A0AAD4L792_9AGAM|nr:carboxypeptidase S1 [Lactarius akahatsu]
MFALSTILTLASVAFAIASPNFVDRRSFHIKDGANHTVFEHAATRATLSFVTNSGNMVTKSSLRNALPSKVLSEYMVLVLRSPKQPFDRAAHYVAEWRSCSSIIGLFQENGPCTFNHVSRSTPVLNPHSWNNFANMLYVDQPIGTGFSFGTDDANATITAAPFVWKLLESQNAAIDKGKVSGMKISLVALGINNGWFDLILHYEAYIDYALRLTNPYRPLINSSQAATYLKAIRLPPLPQAYVLHLQDPTIRSKIGAQHVYKECPDAPYDKFAATSDGKQAAHVQLSPHPTRTPDAHTFLSTLSTFIQCGIQVLIWAGDADRDCNTAGVQALCTPSAACNTACSRQYGVFETAGNLSFLNVFNAGHKIFA